jgi:hypothetical protein
VQISQVSVCTCRSVPTKCGHCWCITLSASVKPMAGTWHQHAVLSICKVWHASCASCKAPCCMSHMVHMAHVRVRIRFGLEVDALRLGQVHSVEQKP